MEVINCLVSELWSEKHHRHGTQLFKKTQCFYVATVNCLHILSCYIKFTHVVKKQLGSRQRQLGKTAGAYIVSMDRKTRQPYEDWKLLKSHFFEERVPSCS